MLLPSSEGGRAVRGDFMEEGAWSWPWRIVDLGNHLRSQISLEETQAEPVTLCKCQVSE